MADAQLVNRFAWALEILGPATIRRATTDLHEAAAVTTLGDFYKKGLKGVSADARVVERLPSLFYGVRRRSGMEVILSNADGDMDPTAEWRGAPFTLWHYDREQDVARVDLAGLVSAASFANGQATFTLDTVDDALLQDLLPAATINPDPSSPFATSASPGKPIPVVFGSEVPIQPPSIYVDLETQGSVEAYDYALGFGNDLGMPDAFGDWDQNRAGLERYGVFSGAPGSPTYLSIEQDALWQQTRFSVTGDQSVRYTNGMPIRFKTTVSGSNYLYSTVKAYHSDLTPHQVEVFDNYFDSGLNGVQIGGDYQIIRDLYIGVTDGLLPVPGTGVNITAIRMFNGEAPTLLTLVNNPTYPSGSGGTHVSTIIGAIIVNAVWGMSSRVQQSIDGTTFSAAAVTLALAGLGGAVQGALGYDGKQLPAEQVLDALCMIARGARLGKNASGAWTMTVDAQTSSIASFVFGPGLESGVRIKKILSYGRAPLNQAIRNLILHWLPLGRHTRNTYNPQDYGRFSAKAVSGLGQDRHIYNPFIRDSDVAEKVLQYLAEMMKGADEQLVFTAGVEARDRTVGEVITAISTVDGFSGDWKITEVSKSLTEVQLTCIRNRDQAYDSPSGITHSAEPSDAPNQRTPPGPGPNLLPNPEPAPTLHPSIDPDISFDLPHGWEISYNAGAASLTDFTVDKSEAVRTKTVSGHYVRMVWSAVAPGGPATSPSGLTSDQIAIRGGTDHIISFYGDAPDGWYIVVSEDDDPDFTTSIPTLIKDDTDTDGNGWTRYYARWKPKNATKRAFITISVSSAGTYNFAGIQVEPVTGSARKPTDWRRHQLTPASFIRTHAITLDGSSSYTWAGIKAGDYVLGAVLNVTSAITYGTATHYALGTTIDPDVWARGITGTALGTATSSRNYKQGTVAQFYNEDTNVLLDFYSGAGTPDTPGTALSGEITITLEYTRSAPAVGP